MPIEEMRKLREDLFHLVYETDYAWKRPPVCHLANTVINALNSLIYYLERSENNEKEDESEKR